MSTETIKTILTLPLASSPAVVDSTIHVVTDEEFFYAVK